MVPLTACSTCRPPNHGQVPAARFRHSAVHVTARQGSNLHRAVAEGLSSIPDSRASFLQERGHLVLLFGGYDTQGREFGGPDLEVSCSSSSIPSRQPQAPVTACCMSEHASWSLGVNMLPLPLLISGHCIVPLHSASRLILLGSAGDLDP